jgi:hypothetical protein
VPAATLSIDQKAHQQGYIVVLYVFFFFQLMCARHFIFIQWVHHVFRLQVFSFQGWANIYTSRQKKTFCVELRGDFLLREKGELEKREGAVEE